MSVKLFIAFVPANAGRFFCSLSSMTTCEFIKYTSNLPVRGTPRTKIIAATLRSIELAPSFSTSQLNSVVDFLFDRRRFFLNKQQQISSYLCKTLTPNHLERVGGILAEHVSRSEGPLFLKGVTALVCTGWIGYSLRSTLREPLLNKPDSMNDKEIIELAKSVLKHFEITEKKDRVKKLDIKVGRDGEVMQVLGKRIDIIINSISDQTKQDLDPNTIFSCLLIGAKLKYRYDETKHKIKHVLCQRYSTFTPPVLCKTPILMKLIGSTDAQLFIKILDEIVGRANEMSSNDWYCFLKAAELVYLPLAEDSSKVFKMMHISSAQIVTDAAITQLENESFLKFIEGLDKWDKAENFLSETLLQKALQKVTSAIEFGQDNNKSSLNVVILKMNSCARLINIVKKSDSNADVATQVPLFSRRLIRLFITDSQVLRSESFCEIIDLALAMEKVTEACANNLPYSDRLINTRFLVAKELCSTRIYKEDFEKYLNKLFKLLCVISVNNDSLLRSKELIDLYASTITTVIRRKNVFQCGIVTQKALEAILEASKNIRVLSSASLKIEHQTEFTGLNNLLLFSVNTSAAFIKERLVDHTPKVKTTELRRFLNDRGITKRMIASTITGAAVLLDRLPEASPLHGHLIGQVLQLASVVDSEVLGVLPKNVVKNKYIKLVLFNNSEK